MARQARLGRGAAQRRPGPGAAVRGGRGPRGRGGRRGARGPGGRVRPRHVRTLRPRPRLGGKAVVEHRARRHARLRRARRRGRPAAAAAATRGGAAAAAQTGGEARGGDRSAKPTGKGPVKQQRLNGQSGIGDHCVSVCVCVCVCVQTYRQSLHTAGFACHPTRYPSGSLDTLPLRGTHEPHLHRRPLTLFRRSAGRTQCVSETAAELVALAVVGLRPARRVHEPRFDCRTSTPLPSYPRGIAAQFAPSSPRAAQSRPTRARRISSRTGGRALKDLWRYDLVGRRRGRSSPRPSPDARRHTMAPSPPPRTFVPNENPGRAANTAFRTGATRNWTNLIAGRRRAPRFRRHACSPGERPPCSSPSPWSWPSS